MPGKQPKHKPKPAERVAPLPNHNPNRQHNSKKEALGPNTKP